MLSRASLALVLLLTAALPAQQLSRAITADPTYDPSHPPTTPAIAIPSHGEQLNGIAFLAAGEGPHPVVLLLHGFPGAERNLDLAQAMRRDGFSVVTFNYRGAWGTHGDFSFTHSMEDTQTAIDWLRLPATAAKLHIDPKNIILMGHSMGGMIAAYIGGHDPAIRAIGLISAADMADHAARDAKGVTPAAGLQATEARLTAFGMAPLAGCTAEGLARELVANATRWSLPGQATGLSSRPILLVTSDDGLTPVNEVLATNLLDAHDTHVVTTHLPTDHVYSGQRIALENTVLTWLDTLPK